VNLQRGNIIRHVRTSREYVVRRVVKRDDKEDQIYLLSPMGPTLQPMSNRKISVDYTVVEGEAWTFPQCVECRGALERAMWPESDRCFKCQRAEA